MRILREIGLKIGFHKYNPEEAERNRIERDNIIKNLATGTLDNIIPEQRVKPGATPNF